MVETQLNFFLIGVPKGGTTLLHARLSEHPSVYLSPLKEPNRFATDIDPGRFSPAFKANTRFDTEAYLSRRPLAPRQIGFIQNDAQYAALFEGARNHHTVIGECSTSYMWSANAAAQVARAYPQAKILVVLRDPVERLFSHWLMARKYGFTGLDLLEAVKQDQAHPDPGWGRSELFVQAGLYAEQLARWYAAFPRDQVQVLFNEELSDDRTWLQLEEWLQLEGTIPLASGPRVNQAGLARWEGLNSWVTRSGAKKWASRMVPKAVKGSIGRWWYTQQALPTLSAADRAVLFAYFEEDVRQLEDLLDVNLDRWRP